MAGISVFARQGTVGLHARLRTAPEAGVAWFAMLPHVMPLLAQRPARVPNLRITAGHAGGEVLAVTSAGHVRKEDLAVRSDAGGTAARRVRNRASGSGC